jgi:hypothetical protein
LDFFDTSMAVPKNAPKSIALLHGLSGPTAMRTAGGPGAIFSGELVAGLSAGLALITIESVVGAFV